MKRYLYLTMEVHGCSWSTEARIPLSAVARPGMDFEAVEREAEKELREFVFNEISTSYCVADERGIFVGHLEDFFKS